MSMLVRQRDPWWGQEGRSARHDRLLRRALGLIVIALSAVLLTLMLARITSLDASPLIVGSGQSVILGALMLDIATCLLLVAGQLREGRLG
jgi:hypothetical protein